MDEKAKVEIQNRPPASSFWAEYLNYNDYNTVQVWKKIGGNIGRSYSNENSCAARVSRGLNYSGAPIPEYHSASKNFSDQEFEGVYGDDKRYIVSAVEISRYLGDKWGNPDHTITTEDQLSAINSNLGSKIGIFATPTPPGGEGHSGVLKAQYVDPYVNGFLSRGIQIQIWIVN